MSKEPGFITKQTVVTMFAVMIGGTGAINSKDVISYFFPYEEVQSNQEVIILKIDEYNKLSIRADLEIREQNKEIIDKLIEVIRAIKNIKGDK